MEEINAELESQVNDYWQKFSSMEKDLTWLTSVRDTWYNLMSEKQAELDTANAQLKILEGELASRSKTIESILEEKIAINLEKERLNNKLQDYEQLDNAVEDDKLDDED